MGKKTVSVCDSCVRTKIFTMLCELIEDISERVDATYLMALMNSGAGTVAEKALVNRFITENKAFVAKLDAMRDLIKVEEVGNG